MEERYVPIEVVYHWIATNKNYHTFEIDSMKYKIAQEFISDTIAVDKTNGYVFTKTSAYNRANITKHVADKIGNCIIRCTVPTHKPIKLSDLADKPPFPKMTAILYRIDSNGFDEDGSCLVYNKDANAILYARYPMVSYQSIINIMPYFERFIGYGTILQGVGMDAETAWEKAYKMTIDDFWPEQTNSTASNACEAMGMDTD